MRILIIGGTGTISTGIVKMLIEQGHNVSLYNRGSASIEGAKTIIGDRTKYEFFERKMQEQGWFDCVIDMIGYSPEDELSAIKAFRGRIGQFIFCSTVDIFKKPAASYPIKEGDQRGANPLFEYAYNKVKCEEILEEAHKRGDFPVTIIRPAATYNDNSFPLGLICSGDSLLERIRTGKPIVVLGDGTSLWVSTHRDDVARAFVTAVGNSNTYGKAYNVMGDEFITWEAYYDTVARVMRAPAVKYVHIATELLGKIAPSMAEWCMLNFKFNNLFDNSLAKRELNFSYTINWEEGVNRMIAYHDLRGEIDSAEGNPFYDRLIERYTDLCDHLVKALE